jgi:hypothetical protein
MRILCGRMRKGDCFSRPRGRPEPSWGDTIELLELTREVAAIVITQGVSRFAHVAAVAEEFLGSPHSYPLEPGAWGFAPRAVEEQLQSPHRYATLHRERLHGVFHLVSELRPVLDAVQGGVHLTERWSNGVLDERSQWQRRVMQLPIKR